MSAFKKQMQSLHPPDDFWYPWIRAMGTEDMTVKPKVDPHKKKPPISNTRELKMHEVIKNTNTEINGDFETYDSSGKKHSDYVRYRLLKLKKLKKDEIKNEESREINT